MNAPRSTVPAVKPSASRPEDRTPEAATHAPGTRRARPCQPCPSPSMNAPTGRAARPLARRPSDERADSRTATGERAQPSSRRRLDRRAARPVARMNAPTAAPPPANVRSRPAVGTSSGRSNAGRAPAAASGYAVRAGRGDRRHRHRADRAARNPGPLARPLDRHADRPRSRAITFRAKRTGMNFPQNY